MGKTTYPGARSIDSTVRNGLRPSVVDFVVIDADSARISTGSTAANIPYPIGDGSSHPVSDFIGAGKAWADLAACQIDYPHVTADTDELAWAAMQAMVNAASGRECIIPAGIYYIGSSYVSITSPISIIGDGMGVTTIKGSGAVPSGYGLFHSTASSDVKLEGFTVDGNITSATVLTGSEGSYDPIGTTLADNSSFRIVGPISGVTIKDVEVIHTGGYAILFDARAGDISDVTIRHNLIRNCRPHTYKYQVGDPEYGSWTGGIFFKGSCNGNTYIFNSVVVADNHFVRVTGNCIWSHSSGFDAQFRNFTITGNVGFGIGRDFIEPGNIDGFTISGNSCSHVGYLHSADDGALTAAYSGTSSYIYAVAYDSTGWSSGSITGNHAASVYGGGIDLDGFRRGVVSGNSLEAEGTIGKGIQTGDSSGNGGAESVHITGNKVEGFPWGGIILANALSCLVSENVIIHPATATYEPIQIYAGTTVPDDNVVERNHIDYTNAAKYAVVESGSGWASTHVNYVGGNRLFGEVAGEFSPASGSGSTWGVPLFSTAADRCIMVRELGAAPTFKIYDIQSSTRNQVSSLDLTNGLQNISVAGAVQTGVVTTANRSSLSAFKDAVWTGKLLSDGFEAIYDYVGVSTSYRAADANALDDSWALLRFNATNDALELSTTTSGGARVWTSLLASVGGSNTHIQFNDSGALGGSADLIFDKTTRYMAHTGQGIFIPRSAATIAMIVKGASAQTANLQEWQNSSGTALAAVSSAGYGYFTAAALRTDYVSPKTTTDGKYGGRDIQFRQLSTGASPPDAVTERSDSCYIAGDSVSYNGSAGEGLVVVGSSTATIPRLVTVKDFLIVTGRDAAASILVNDGYVQSAEGFTTSATAYNSIQAASGGMLSLRSTYGTLTPDPTGVAGYGIIYFNGTSFYAIEGTGSPTPLVPSAGTYVTLATDQTITGMKTFVRAIDAESFRWSGTGQPLVYGFPTITTDSFVAIHSVGGAGMQLGSYAVGGGSSLELRFQRSGGSIWSFSDDPSATSWFTIGTYLSVHSYARFNVEPGASNKVAVDVYGRTGQSVPYQRWIDNYTGQNQLCCVNRYGHFASGSTIPAIVGRVSASNGYRPFFGMNVDFDGSNWKLYGDGVNNGGAMVGCNYGTGHIEFFSVPSTAGTDKSVSDTTMGSTYKVAQFDDNYLYFLRNATARGIFPETDAYYSIGSSSYRYLDVWSCQSRVYGRADEIQSVVKAYTGQTADMAQWRNSSDTVLAYLQANGTIYATAFGSTGSSTATVNIPNGGVSAKWLIGTTSLTLTDETEANAGLSGSGQSRFYSDSTKHRLLLSENGGAYAEILRAGSGLTADYFPVASSAGVVGNSSVYKDGSYILRGSGDVRFNKLYLDGADSTVCVTLADGYMSSAEGYYSAGTATTTFNAPNGGITVKWLIGTVSVSLTETDSGTAGLSTSGNCRLYMNSTSHRLLLSENAGAYQEVLRAGSGLSTNYFPVASSAGVVGDSSVYKDGSYILRGGGDVRFNKLYLAGADSVWGIYLADGYIDSAEGFYSGGISYQTVNVGSGGTYARSHRSIYYTQLGNSSGAPSVTTGDGFQAGAVYWDTSGTPALKVYNGSTWVTVSTSSGVTSMNSLTGALSIAGTSNQISVSPSGSTITLSTPQDIHTSATPTFASVKLSNLTTQYFPVAKASGELENSSLYKDGSYIVRGSGDIRFTKLYLAGADAVWSLYLADGYVDSAEGYYSGGSSYQTLNIGSGGSYARSHRSVYYTQIGTSSGEPSQTSGDGKQAGMIYWDTFDGYIKVWSGSAWEKVVTTT